MKTSPNVDEVVVLFAVYCLPLRAVIPGHYIIHIEVIPTLDRSSLLVTGGMNTEGELIIFG